MPHLFSDTIHSIEPLNEQQSNLICKSLNCKLYLIDRDYILSSVEVHKEIESLICRDRDSISEILDLCPNLKFIFIVSVGVEGLPFEKLIKRGVTVANTSGINAEIMSQYAIGAILSFSTRIIENYSNQQNSFWKKYQCVESLVGQKLLIVGAGHTGKLIAKKANTFGMHCIGIKTNYKPIEYFNKLGTLSDLPKLLPEADYIVCAIPLTKETENLFNKDTFALFKDSAVFVNISRGKLVDEDDLINALKINKFRGAVLDVFRTEPVLPDNEMWRIPNLLISPHSSGRLADFMDKAVEIFIQNMGAFKMKGRRIPNLVNLQKKY